MRGLPLCSCVLAMIAAGVLSASFEAVHAQQESSFLHEKFITWGFEDWDFPPDNFKMYFDGPVSITRIEGFVAASMLPENPKNHPHKEHYIRQALIFCHNGTRAPIRGEHAVEPWTKAEQPKRLRRYEQSLTFTPLEINIKQHDRYPVHLPVSYHYRVGDVIIPEGKPFVCHTDLQTYTGEGTDGSKKSKNGYSTDDWECIDLEVHFVIHYVSLPRDAQQFKPTS